VVPAPASIRLAMPLSSADAVVSRCDWRSTSATLVRIAASDLRSARAMVPVSSRDPASGSSVVRSPSATLSSAWTTVFSGRLMPRATRTASTSPSSTAAVRTLTEIVTAARYWLFSAAARPAACSSSVVIMSVTAVLAAS
jgi:hypothetical protein